MSKKQILLILLVLGIGLGGLLYSRKGKQTETASAFLSPRFPSRYPWNPSDQEMMNLAKKVARQTRGWTRLGLAKPGEKALIMIPRAQDMRVFKAILTAVKERGVEADYIYDDQLYAEAYGKSEVTPVRTPPSLRARSEGVKDGRIEGYFNAWPKFLPEDQRKQALELMGTLDERSNEVHKNVLATKMYLDKHPEYKAFYGENNGTYMLFAEMEIGAKFVSFWWLRSLASFRQHLHADSPNDLLRLIEDKVLEVLPWV